MPEPFRLFAPLPPIKEKVVLVHSDDLLLALPAALVQEVVLAATIRAGRKGALNYYNGQEIPVILGQRACGKEGVMPMVVLKTPELRTGFLGIVCTELPQLAAIGAEEWQPCRSLPYPWVSSGKGFVKGHKLFTAVEGIKF
ncbi:MAG: hypothetical protein RMK91_09810 [Pseudanabaenaceae cyanobacterium SKYGB_i_bin29]|nr:hypothetical protein [Pseudanabaenaceae cyanobacterium SKYG29]MDW8422148.1 hypothetical protein [Pseudanabaenaceae cyanobacterium SKYGB_i_bin29]